MNCEPCFRTAFCTAWEATFATSRSTTDEYSSITTRSPSASASALAMVARNASPDDSVLNGRTQAGGEPKPTDESSAVMSLMPSVSGKPSRTDGCDGQRYPSTTLPTHRCEAITDFPAPDGPITSPTFHSWSSRGRSWSQTRCDFSASGISDCDTACCTRGGNSTGDETSLSVFMQESALQRPYTSAATPRPGMAR